MSLSPLKKSRMHEKALLLASIVGTSSLEMQGLEEESLNSIIASYEKEFLTGNYQDTLWVV